MLFLFQRILGNELLLLKGLRLQALQTSSLIDVPNSVDSEIASVPPLTL